MKFIHYLIIYISYLIILVIIDILVRKYIYYNSDNFTNNENNLINSISNKKTAIVFIFDKKIGFYSQFFFLCHAYIYAQNNNYDFFIDSSNWAYKSSLGWHDYFNSLTEVSYIIKKNYATIINFYHNSNNRSYDYTVNDYIQTINKIYILKNSIVNRAQDYINNIIKSDYTSIYVRRGDKISETKNIDVKDIVNKINIDNSTKLFIQTDDYTVIKEFKLFYPNNNTYYTVPNTSIGSVSGKDYGNNLDNRSHTEELLIGTYICSNSKESWTDITSNVSRFIILNQRNKINTYPDNIILDYNKKINPWFNL